MNNARKTIGFIGAGNVATHLATRLNRLGHSVVAVASRNYESAKSLAAKIGAEAIQSLDTFPSDLDFIIIAATDGSIAQIAKELPSTRAVVVHTSGSVPLGALSSKHPRAAVLYPLQTFSKDIDVKVSEAPFFIEATDSDTLHEIESLAREISHSVWHADSTVRSKLHVAGVLSSNFTIYLLEMARKVLAECGLPLSTIKPLVETSISKAFNESPLDALTGPARRGDLGTIEKQSNSFANQLEKNIYDSVTQAIIETFKNKTKNEEDSVSSRKD